MCRPCFSVATKTIASVRVILPWRPIKVTLHPQIVHWDPLNPKLSRPQNNFGIGYVKMHGFHGIPLYDYRERGEGLQIQSYLDY